jgi:phytol kinase
MSKEILNTIILAASVIGLLGFAEILYHFLGLKAELTRKFVHISTGLLTLLFPVMLGSHWLVLFLCVSFGILLTLSIRFRLLQSVNGIKRKSAGSIAFPIAVYGSYLVFEFFGHQYIYYYLPVLILAICDPVAALTGKKWPIGQYKSGEEYKTAMGSVMFCISAMLVSAILFSILGIDLNYMYLSGIAAVSAIAEGLSRKGYDNITIPVSVICSLFIFEKLI